MRVLVAPDSFGGTFAASAAAAAIAEGWSRARPTDEVTPRPMSDGGEGLIDVLAREDDESHDVEVADPRGRPTTARWLWRADGTAIIESAEACGLRLLPSSERDPLRTTTYGVGQLLRAALDRGARRFVVGLGGSATVDGGAGALTALGVRIRRGDGSGLKVGGEHLHEVANLEPTWVDERWRGVEIELWADVVTALPDAATTFGPQKGATPRDVAVLTEGLERWADVVERDLGGRWRDLPGSGAAGGLGFGLAALGGRLRPGAEAVAGALDVHAVLETSDVVVTGEGRIDATTSAGKVVGYLLGAASARGIPVLAVSAQRGDAPSALSDLEVATADGEVAGVDDLRSAAERLASRFR